MTESDHAATTDCPLERASVDLERCTRCYWKSAGEATCTGIDRASAKDWHFLLRALSV